MDEKSRIQALLDSTNDPRFKGTVSTIKRFYSLSNEVFKVDLSDGRAFVVKIEDPTKINLLTFYKPQAMSIIKKMKYGAEIFLYSKNHLEIEQFLLSQGMTQKNFVSEGFRFNVMRNAAEFNSLDFDDGKENFWNLMKQRGVVEECAQATIPEIVKYREKKSLEEIPDKEVSWTVKDGLIGKQAFRFYLNFQTLLYLKKPLIKKRTSFRNVQR